MLAKPGLSEAQRASILKIQGRRAARMAAEAEAYQQVITGSQPVPLTVLYYERCGL
jgi:hypothetical protein